MTDAGYDSKNIQKILRDLNYIPLIDQNKICELKQMRRVNLRYDGLIETYESYVYMAMIYPKYSEKNINP
jgi:vacuolar-type H+-ATPase subunit I/STV1